MGGRKTDLVIIDGNLNDKGYVNNVLRPIVVPFSEQHYVCLMHDNARLHTARLTQAFLNRHDINVLPLPACFSDINPI